ncbi:MAG: hypothetical protein JW821_01700 [Deltaproteobacteria bacterium]|nr:hypothetical protein [Deltaproteobacteria bacterium]
MKDFSSVSPLRVLDKSSRGGLGKGNMGVLMARAGVGKTACLIHIAFDKLFRKEKLVHISLEDVPEKITSYYNVIFNDLVKALNWQNENDLRMLVERNRMILSYLNRSFQTGRLRENLRNLIERVDFAPDTLIVDGVDFSTASREFMEEFRGLAAEFQVETWFSARAHRHIQEVNERGIPYPCNHLDDLFGIIVQLLPAESGLELRLLKDHDGPAAPDASVFLDPNTFLLMA